MGSISWLDANKGIALWKFADDDTMDRIMEDYRLFCEMVNNAGHKTYSVIDLLDLEIMPRNAMKYYPEMARLAPGAGKRSEVIAIVTRRVMVSMSTELFTHIYPDFRDRFISFPTVEQALDHIEEHIRHSAA